MRAASDLRALTGGPSKIGAVANLREGVQGPKPQRKEQDMTTPNRDSLAKGMVSIGEDAIAKSNDALLDDYYTDYYTDDYRLHSPAGDFSRDEIKAYFAALRESITDFTISRAQILVDGNFVSARTVMAGRF
jgi:hypothetical protein